MLSQNRDGVLVTGTPSSSRRFLIHEISAAALARALYSASVDDRAVDDRETAFYIEECQEMMLEPWYKRYVVVDLPPSCIPPQSESENACKSSEDCLFKNNPWCKVPFKHQRTRFRACQCDCLGLCMN